jgi:hypothetical protein
MRIAPIFQRFERDTVFEAHRTLSLHSSTLGALHSVGALSHATRLRWERSTICFSL